MPLISYLITENANNRLIRHELTGVYLVGTLVGTGGVWCRTKLIEELMSDCQIQLGDNCAFTSSNKTNELCEKIKKDNGGRHGGRGE